jgi:hypothetical protein
VIFSHSKREGKETSNMEIVCIKRAPEGKTFVIKCDCNTYYHQLSNRHATACPSCRKVASLAILLEDYSISLQLDATHASRLGEASSAASLCEE